MMKLKPRRGRKGKRHTYPNSSPVTINPKAPEGHINEAGATLGGFSSAVGHSTLVDNFIRLAWEAGPEKLPWYREALLHPDRAVQDPKLRPRVAEVLSTFVDIIFSDSQTYWRLYRMMQAKHGREVGVNEQTVDTAAFDPTAKPPWQLALEKHSGRLAEGLSPQKPFDLAAFKKTVAAKLAASAEE